MKFLSQIGFQDESRNYMKCPSMMTPHTEHYMMYRSWKSPASSVALLPASTVDIDISR